MQCEISNCFVWYSATYVYFNLFISSSCCYILFVSIIYKYDRKFLYLKKFCAEYERNCRHIYPFQPHYIPYMYEAHIGVKFALVTRTASNLYTPEILASEDKYAIRGKCIYGECAGSNPVTAKIENSALRVSQEDKYFTFWYTDLVLVY